MFQDLIDPGNRLGDIAFLETSIEVIVKRPQAHGELTTLSHIQRLVHLVNDGLGALDVVVDGFVELLGVILGKALAGLFQETDDAIIQQHDQLAWRGSLGRHLAIGLPGLRLLEHTGRLKLALRLHLNGQ
jgi:hypothetical protein